MAGVKIFGLAEGVIIASELVTSEDTDGKPHVAVSVLQNPKVAKNKPELNLFKDENLKAISQYPTGADFQAVVRVGHWSMNGNHGLSAWIIENRTNAKTASSDKKLV